MSGSFTFNGTSTDAIAGGSRWNARTSSSAFQSAMEPLFEDLLHLGVSGEDGDHRITNP